MMLKNILFLLACIALVFVAWGVFQIFGEYAFNLMLVITLVLLLFRVGKPKFGRKE